MSTCKNVWEKLAGKTRSIKRRANTAVGVLIGGVGIRVAVFAAFATSISYRDRLVVGETNNYIYMGVIDGHRHALDPGDTRDDVSCYL